MRMPFRVSIRAPARGATDAEVARIVQQLFRSAPPHGGRHALGTALLGMIGQFRSAPPHGGRPKHPGFYDRRWRFDPRPRTGGDEAVANGNPVWGYVSIRAPARGATLLRWASELQLAVSIRAPARGATRQCLPTANR